MRSAECAVLGNFTDEVTLLGVAGQITLGILDLDLPCDIRDIIADVKNLAETDRVRWNLIGMLAFDLIGLIPVIGVLKYSDETAESIASGEKILKESQTIYESFADMMSPEDAKRYLDFLENGKKTIRWYDSEGKAYRDVDMSDHGNFKEHPEVPHEHTWEYNNGKPKRN